MEAHRRASQGSHGSPGDVLSSLVSSSKNGLCKPGPSGIVRRRYTDGTHGFKEQMRIGTQMANALGTPLLRLEDCAEIFGISAEMVRKIERRALYKIWCRMLSDDY